MYICKSQTLIVLVSDRELCIQLSFFGCVAEDARARERNGSSSSPLFIYINIFFLIRVKCAAIHIYFRFT